MDIKDSVVLVTGGNRGLGKSLVQAFLSAGARKIYVGSRTPIETSDPRLQPIKLDITNAQDAAAAAQTCQDVNILMNNAAIATSHPILTESLDGVHSMMETNYFGTLSVIRAFAPILKRNGGGTLVNMLSVLSWATSPLFGSSYSASKHAALSLTNSVRIELRSQGTRVIAVFAGFIDTDMAAHVTAPKAKPEDVAASIIEGIRNDHEEILADQASHDFKAALASNPQGFYQTLQASWDNAQKQA